MTQKIQKKKNRRKEFTENAENETYKKQQKIT